jgi:potassium-dependent mechanosensitive channel
MTSLVAVLLVFFGWTLGLAQAQERSGASGSVPQLLPKVLQKDEAPERGKDAKSAAPAFPGLAEVVPRSAEISKHADDVEARIVASADTSLVEKQIADVEPRLARLRKQVSEAGDPREWDIYRLLDNGVLFAKENKALEGYLGPLSARLTELETLRKEWEEKQAHWSDWRKHLVGSQVEPPEEAFQKVEDVSRRILQEISNASARLVGLQQRITRLIDQNRYLSAPIAAALTRLRDETFEKTEPSFLSRVFREQFDANLWFFLHMGLVTAGKEVPDSLRRYGWWMLLQLLLVVSVAVLARRRRPSPETEGDWWGLTKHPWALAIFVAGALSFFLFPSPTGAWRFLTRSVFVFSGSILILAPVADRRKRRIVFGLATVIVLCDFLKVISLPTSLYRLYLALLSLAGFFLLARAVRRGPRDQAERTGLFSLGLWIGMCVTAVAFLAQISGYANLSDRLFLATIATVFLGISVVMLLRITHVGTELILSRPRVAQRRIVRESGLELRQRLTSLWKIFIGVLGILALLPLWGIFASTTQAWEKIFHLRFAVGDLSMSLGLLATAVLVLYLSTWISWFLRSFLEAEVFPRGELDRGARDAITKLLHYFLVLVGFLLGISVLGIDLKSFVVLGGALGIGLGFGLQAIVNNFISGLILLFERPVKVGDMVEVDKESGRVKKIGLRSTIIETFDRAELIVPNSHLISGNVTNWTLTSRMARLKIPVGVAYGTPLELVLKALTAAAETNARVLRDPPPLAIFAHFGDSSLECELQVWIPDVKDMLLARSEIGQEIDRRFRQAGIEIAFPQRVVHLRSAKGEIDAQSGPQAQ